jgi:shikimate kinase
MILFLVGLPFSGKSYYARLLAKREGDKCIDLDELIEKKFNKSPRQLFNDHGELFFRLKEFELLSSLNEKKAVVALGGGTLLYEPSRLFIMNLGCVVYLKLNPTIIKKRIDALKEKPAYYTNFEDLLKRLPIYEKASHNMLDISFMSDEKVLEELKKIYGS